MNFDKKKFDISFKKKKVSKKKKFQKKKFQKKSLILHFAYVTFGMALRSTINRHQFGRESVGKIFANMGGENNVDRALDLLRQVTAILSNNGKRYIPGGEGGRAARTACPLMSNKG